MLSVCKKTTFWLRLRVLTLSFGYCLPFCLSDEHFEYTLVSIGDKDFWWQLQSDLSRGKRQKRMMASEAQDLHKNCPSFCCLSAQNTFRVLVCFIKVFSIRPSQLLFFSMWSSIAISSSCFNLKKSNLELNNGNIRKSSAEQCMYEEEENLSDRNSHGVHKTNCHAELLIHSKDNVLLHNLQDIISCRVVFVWCFRKAIICFPMTIGM